MMRPVLPADPEALRRHQARYRTACRAAWIAGAFSLLVAALMGLDYAQRLSADPLNHPGLVALKQQLAGQPRNEELKTRIRVLDRELRAQYFRHQARARSGAWLLTGGAAVLVLAVFALNVLKPVAPQPLRGTGRDAAQWREAPRARRSVGVLGGTTMAVLAALAAWTVAPAIPDDHRETAGAPEAAPKPPPVVDEAAYARNWPRFRGPDGSGRSPQARFPATWSAESGAHILWKAPIPLPGVSSPIVWNDLVVVTGAQADKRAVFGFDAASGKLRWTGYAERVPDSPREAPEVLDDTGFAAPTPATDGQRVYAIFANGDLIAFSLHGQRVWARSLGLPSNGYGHAASLLTWKDLLLVPWDQSEDAALWAFDSASGKEAWKRTRAVHCSWTTPIIAKIGEADTIVTCAQPKVAAYRLPTGEEAWRIEGLEGELGSSPVWDGERLFAVGTDSRLFAIEVKGGAAQTVWTLDRDLPDITSPLSDGKRLWLLTTQGQLSCYATKDGHRLYSRQLEGEFFASPVLLGDRLLLLATSGQAYWVAAADEFKLLGSASFGERVQASPAVAGGRLFVRGARHLFCIAAQEGPQP